MYLHSSYNIAGLHNLSVKCDIEWSDSRRVNFVRSAPDSFCICLYSQHIDEAKQEGLGEDVVPDILFQDEDEVNKEMQLLMLMQQQLMADLQKGYAEADEEVRKQSITSLDDKLWLCPRFPSISQTIQFLLIFPKKINDCCRLSVSSLWLKRGTVSTPRWKRR